MKPTLPLIVMCVLGCQLQAQVSFKLSSSPGAGNGPNSVVAADVNGDGKPDLICSDLYGDAVTVLTNNGSGDFVLAGTFAVGHLPYPVTPADVNGDGKVDLICVNGGSGTLSVLTNSGSGRFVLSSSPVIGNAPQSVATADVNGDGKVDLITANFGQGAGNTLTVLTNNGSGGFVVASSPVVGNGAESVAAADVNGDGKADLICANRGDSTVSVLTNNGSGGFVLAGTNAVGSGPFIVTTADVNGDGKVDLTTANYGPGAGNTLTVLTNNGSGRFVFSSTLNVGIGVFYVAAADVNGDGKLDLVSANNTDSTLSVLTNNGSGGFVLATNLSVGKAPDWVAVADINGDGKPDLITANSGNNTLSVLANATPFPIQGQLAFKLSSSPGVGDAPNSVGAADVNEDGKLDLISANYYGNSLSVLTNNGNGGSVLSGTYPVGSLPIQVTAADVNWDGKLDLICANSDGADSTLSVLTNNGNGRFVLAGTYPVGIGPASVTAVDVNGDGKADLISANQGYAQEGHTLTVLTNNGSGGFVLASSPVVGLGPYSVTAADVNRDGKVDLICANKVDGTLSVLTNNGSGGFVLAGTCPVGSGPAAVTATDVNGDGSVDLISANWGGGGGNTLTVLTNNGIGIFGSNATLTVGSGPLGVAAADVNGDSKVDLISANHNANTLTVLTNNGNGGFVLATNLSAGGNPNSVTAADVNGDAKLDLISANGGNNTLSVFTNATVYSASFLIITSQPQSQTNIVGATVTFQVGATSSIPLSYQWRKNTTNLVDGGNLSGARTNTLTLMNISGNDAGIYSVIVSNAIGSVTSSNAVLTVIPATSPAIGTAILSGSFVTGVNITDGGRGYTNTPLVRFIGGGGTGVVAFAVVSNGVVTSIIVTNAGFGYTTVPVVVIDPPLILNPVLGIAPMSFLTFSNLAIGGTYQLQQLFLYYWTNQPVNFMASNALYTQMVAGAVGSGSYRLALNPVPTQAFATAQMFNGFVVGATVTSGGSGYVTSPAVSIVGRSVIGAGAFSSISGGVVTSITVTNAGYGYTNAPTIQIAPPPAAAVFPAVQPVMRVDSASLAPYDNYQIQFKPDIMAPWMNWDGGLFSPTSATNSQYIFITNGVGFFRLQYVP